jgi:hypothetical protein
LWQGLPRLGPCRPARRFAKPERSIAKQEAGMTDDPLGWLDCVPLGSDRATAAKILLCFERTMLCDERLPEDYRREVRERVWRHIYEDRRHFDARPFRRRR